MLRTLLVLGSAFALAQQPAQGASADVSVLELVDDPGVAASDVMKVFTQLGVPESQAMPLVQKVRGEGKAIVMAGAPDKLEQVVPLFTQIGIKAAVRATSQAELDQLMGGGEQGGNAQSGSQKANAPQGEYSGSDVIQADAAMFEKLMADKSQGTLVAFYAPWCGPCRQMVPEFKKAAASLRASGIRTAAVDCQANQKVAQAMGVKGFPTVKFIYNGGAADYQGPRTAVELANFGRQQHGIAKLKGMVGGAVKSMAKLSKLAMSKVLGTQGSGVAAPAA